MPAASENAIASAKSAYKLVREQWVPQPIEQCFAFFSRPENLQAITPPWLDFKILSVPDVLKPGALIRYRLRWRGIRVNWTTEITCWEPPDRFVDGQIRGPYALWHHEHRFVASDGGTLISDAVTYALPFGVLGHVVHRLLVGHDVRKIFDYREQRLKELLGQGSLPSGCFAGAQPEYLRC